jgi:Tfp pilus assembly protein PilN
MRPVNLIPPEERRGTSAPMRTGRVPYVVIGAMFAVVGAVALLASTSASVADRKAEIAALEVEQRDAQARADALRPFAQFAATRQARETTIDSLARSRFDWERVIGELSRVIPADIWLTELTATATPEASVEGSAGLSLRSQITGPALELVGCGRDHESVAGLIAALEDIDGVTRVTATKSAKAPAGSDSSGGGAEDCQTRPSVAAFGLVVGFEGVPSAEAPTTPPAATPAVPASTESASDATTTVAGATP